MKQLTKKNLAELAKTMPSLSESEQKNFIGGTVVIVDRHGNIVQGNNQLIKDYSTLNADKENVYWYVQGKDGTIENNFKSAGSISNNNHNGAINDMDMEGTAINKDVMSFLACNTDVEWSMALRDEESNSGYYGRINTSNSPDKVDVLDYGTGYTEWYHSHPFDNRRPEELGPSSGDYEVANKLTSEDSGYNYKKCTVYEARTGEWITYYGKKDDDEVYVKDMTRP